MATQNITPLEFDGYMIDSGTVLLHDAAGRTQIGIGELVNRDDLIVRLSAEDALRIGSWHGAYIERKNRRDYANPRKSYVVYDGSKSADSTDWGQPISRPLDSSDAAIKECVAARAVHPGACVIESAQFF